jgi:hypothetical protein
LEHSWSIVGVVAQARISSQDGVISWQARGRQLKLKHQAS